MLEAGGIYESAPARFRGLAPSPPAGPAPSAIGEWAAAATAALLLPALSTLAASLAYPVLSPLTAACRIFPFFDPALFAEGPLLLALFAMLGLLPLVTAIPLLSAATFHIDVRASSPHAYEAPSPHQCRLRPHSDLLPCPTVPLPPSLQPALAPDSILLLVSRFVSLPTGPLSAEAIRTILRVSPATIARLLPHGLSLSDDGRAMAVAGPFAMRHLFYPSMAEPLATQYAVAGALWVVVLAFLVHGVILVATSSVLHRALLALPGRHARDIKVPPYRYGWWRDRLDYPAVGDRA